LGSQVIGFFIGRQGAPEPHQQARNRSGATSVLQYVRRDGDGDWSWVGGLLRPRPPKAFAVALANKMTRIAARSSFRLLYYATKSAQRVNIQAAVLSGNELRTALFPTSFVTRFPRSGP